MPRVQHGRQGFLARRVGTWGQADKDSGLARLGAGRPGNPPIVARLRIYQMREFYGQAGWL